MSFRARRVDLDAFSPLPDPAILRTVLDIAPVDAPLPLVVYGSTACEDTAITRSRLRALGVPFNDIDLDRDPTAAAHVFELNGGHRVTPTVVVGADELVAAEPSLERLGELVEAAGHPFERPQAIEFRGELITRPIPFRRLAAANGAPFSLGQLRGRGQVCLFLGHGPDCLACFGYAKQLAAQGVALGEADATPVIVVSGDVDETSSWRHHIGDGATLLADPEASWKTVVAAAVGFPGHEAMVLVLDRLLAPRAGSVAPEAGGLIDPSEVVEWLRLTAHGCPERSRELPWPAEETP